jgi:hypothetical protein
MIDLTKCCSSAHLFDRGRLSALKALRLDATRLSGTVPQELCQIVASQKVSFLIDCSRVECETRCNCTCAS